MTVEVGQDDRIDRIIALVRLWLEKLKHATGGEAFIIKKELHNVMNDMEQFLKDEGLNLDLYPSEVAEEERRKDQ